MKIILFLVSSLAAAGFAVDYFSFFEKNKSQVVHNQAVVADFQKMGNTENPVELGKVNWSRDFEKAKKSALEAQKPLLVLFQEVPGCSTCTRFGSTVLSHPLLVEAIETYFVPVCIHNNKGGDDRRVLEKFGEPAWNNPVVRIVSPEKEADLVPRISGNYTPLGLASGIIAALEKQGKTAPIWLDLLEKNLRAEENGTSEAVFAMSCFWAGEGKLGAMDGVTATQPGYMDGHEVVKVSYDPDVVSYENLVKKSRESGCASTVFCKNDSEISAAEAVVGKNSVSQKSSFRPDREPKYYLSQTVWRFVPMTETQASRANALIGQGQPPAPVLSPRQVELADFISKNTKKHWKEMVGATELVKAWAEVEAVRDKAD